MAPNVGHIFDRIICIEQTLKKNFSNKFVYIISQNSNSLWLTLNGAQCGAFKYSVCEMNYSGLFKKNVKSKWVQCSGIHFFLDRLSWNLGTMENLIYFRDPQKENIFIPVLNLEKLNALESSGAQCRAFKDSVCQTKQSDLSLKKKIWSRNEFRTLKLLPWIGNQETPKNDKEDHGLG